MDLKEYLWKYRLTQTQFAKRAGIKRTSVGSYIRNYRQPNASSALKIYKATNGEVSFREIFAQEFGFDVPDRKNEEKNSDNMSVCL